MICISAVADMYKIIDKVREFFKISVFIKIFTQVNKNISLVPFHAHMKFKIPIFPEFT